MPLCGSQRNARKVVLPERGDNGDDDDGSDNDADQNPQSSGPRPICQSALMAILGVNADAWKTVSKASESNVLPVHSLTNEGSNNKLDNAAIASLKSFFEGLKEHA